MVDDPGWVTYAVLVGGRAAGVLSLMRIDPANGVVEIGAVIFGTPLVRTVASTEAQRLLMGHVFDDLGTGAWSGSAMRSTQGRGGRRSGWATPSRACSGRPS